MCLKNDFLHNVTLNFSQMFAVGKKKMGWKVRHARSYCKLDAQFNALSAPEVSRNDFKFGNNVEMNKVTRFIKNFYSKIFIYIKRMF